MDKKSHQRVKTQGPEFWENVFSGAIMVDVRKRVDIFHVFKPREFSVEPF
jgi:hypothetical protein